MFEGNHPRPVVLCILDGWGERDDPLDNAIAQARTPEWDRLVATCPRGRAPRLERLEGAWLTPCSSGSRPIN